MSFEQETQVSRRQYMEAEIGMPYTIDGWTGEVVDKKIGRSVTGLYNLWLYFVTLKMEDKCPKE